MYKIKKKPPKHKKERFKWFLHLVVILSIAIIVIRYVDHQIIPIASVKVNIIAKNKVNEIINNTVQNIVKELDLTSEKFYIKSVNEHGRVESFSVDTVLVNDFCNKTAAQISDQLGNLNKQKIQFPLGSLFNIQFLSNVGPLYTVEILPMGSAAVDYESSFESVSINQVNFKVWLTVSTDIKIINPWIVQSEYSEIVVERKIALVNTIISGDVPGTIFNGSNMVH